MKKFLTILMATILAVLCLTSVACKDDKKGSSTDFVGSWTLIQVIEDDVDFSDEYLTYYYMSVTLTINSDGTFSMVSNGKELSFSDTTSGTYTITDGTIYLTAEGVTILGTINANGKLDLTRTDTDEGVTSTFTMIFTK